MIKNHSGEILANISMLLNEQDEGGYRHELGRLLPNATLHFAVRVYKKQDRSRYTGSAQQRSPASQSSRTLPAAEGAGIVATPST